MLILTHSIGETIKIGDDIDMTILGVRCNQARIGTNAPQNVEVHHEEAFLSAY